MSVPVETLAQILSELQRQNAENLNAIMKQQYEALNTIVLQGGARGNGQMTDTRGIGRPITFKGEELKYQEWKAKLTAYLRVTNPRCDDWISWAASQSTPIQEEDLDLQYASNKQEVATFAVSLYSTLMSCTEDDQFRICQAGSGLEAYDS